MSYWNIEALTGYKPKTTFWQDFTIADAFGVAGIRDTYKRAFNGWKSNYEYLTELVMVLNWKLWAHHEKGNEAIAKVYQELWEEADQWCCENLKGEALSYYYSTTD